MVWVKFIKHNTRKLILIALFLLSSASLIVWVNNFWFKKEIVIGIISDIHAGNQKTRDDSIESDNILLPSNYKINLEQVLPKMKKMDLILTLGDNLNVPSEKYSEELKEITSGYPLAWTRGNHDKLDSFEKFSKKRYYYIDKRKWRIIILDNAETNPDIETPDDAYDQKGYIDADQMNWLEESLKTKKKVIVAMHVPVFDRFNLDSVYPDQKKLVKLFEDSGNVKFVLAGHYHVYDWRRQINGIEYYILPSFSLRGREGYYMTLNLSN